MHTVSRIAFAAMIMVLNTVPVFAKRAEAPARFDYAENYYELEQPRMPRHRPSAVYRSVAPGQVMAPPGLGVDPWMLAKVPTTVNPANFGQPRQMSAPMVPSVPARMIPVARVAPMSAIAKTAVGPKTITHVSAKLNKPKPLIASASAPSEGALPPVMTYGRKAAYEPMFVTAGESGAVTTHVIARLMPCHK
jgi:hypothetical protein